LVQRLAAVDIECTGKALTRARNRIGCPFVADTPVSGQLIGSAQLPSGWFAMIESVTGMIGGHGLSLVPWQPVLDKRIGQRSSAIAMAGGSVDWSFARSRELGK
jgi:Protein of unknown function (DUF3363)